MELGTILIRNETRERLKKIGRKGQTYDRLINDLIEQTKHRYENSESPKNSASRESGAGRLE